MRNLIIRICRWLIELAGSPVMPLPLETMPVPLGTVHVLEATKALIMLAEDTHRTGEWKRHWVYAKLIKEFPDIEKRDLALAIEVALRRWNSVQVFYLVVDDGTRART